MKSQNNVATRCLRSFCPDLIILIPVTYHSPKCQKNMVILLCQFFPIITLNFTQHDDRKTMTMVLI